MSSTIHSEFRRSLGGEVLTLQAVDSGGQGEEGAGKAHGKITSRLKESLPNASNIFFQN